MARVQLVCLLAAALLAPSVARAQNRFQGGPLDGLGMGEVIRPDNGVRINGLLPSAPNASPIRAEDKPAIAALMAAYVRHDTKKIRRFLAPGATQEMCPHNASAICEPLPDFGARPVAEDCQFNTPYGYLDGGVRLEWLYKGALWYWSEVLLINGKVRRVRTHPADMPVIANTSAQTTRF